MSDEWAKLVPELYVTDIKDSIDFYVNKLGFEIQYNRKEAGFAYLDKEGAQIMLEQFTETTKWQTAELSKPFGRGINFQIEIKDVDELYENLKKLDYPIFVPLEEKWYETGETMGGNRQFLVTDPDGYLLRFFTHLGEKPINK